MRSSCVSQQCRLSYDIKPFKDEVLCDVSPLEVCDVLLGQPYMWKCHVVYESRPRSVIVTLGGQLYRIPEVVPTTVPTKQCRKVISHTAKFSLFTIWSEGEQKDTATTAASPKTFLSNRKINKIVEEHKNILTSPTGVPPHYPINKVITNPFILFMLHLHRQSPPTLRKIMQLDWLNGSNPSNNRFITTFNKLSRTTSSARQATHQGSDSTKASPSSMGT
jgi:hypothetical protein